MANGWTPYIHNELAAGKLRWLHEQYDMLDGHMCPSDKSEVFRAFKLTPLDEVKVVIIGQDPYHTKNIADGLAFSSKNPKKIPPSLRNIFKAIEIDLGIKNTNPSLESWSKQGVLLMNTALTTVVGQPLEHGEYWVDFTKNIIKALNSHKDKLIFLLWGNHAKSLKQIISERHYILEATHPSPLSAKGFINCLHFSETNRILTQEGKTPINWSTDV